MGKKIDFLGIHLNPYTIDETVACINKSILLNRQIHHCVINASKIVQMQNDKVLRESVVSSDLINADGMSIVWAARFLGHKIPERVAGIDLMEKIIELSFEKKYKCFFLGAKENVLKKLVDDYSRKYSRGLIAGYRNGYFDEFEESNIIEKIKQSNAHVLFVGITSPKKEIFLNKYKKDLSNINFIMGVGGSFDVISGNLKRAPKIMQILGLEWFYRLIQEPKRMWKRYLIGNFKFLIIILKAKFKYIFK